MPAELLYGAEYLNRTVNCCEWRFARSNDHQTKVRSDSHRNLKWKFQCSCRAPIAPQKQKQNLRIIRNHPSMTFLSFLLSRVRPFKLKMNQLKGMC